MSRRGRWCATAGVAVLVATVLCATPAAPATVAATAPDFATIDRYVEAEMQDQRIPGLALAIVHDGSTVHVKGFGDAGASGRAVTPNTPFSLGSVTKSFTALAVMQLTEAGKVELDAPVQEYLPWWHVADADASARVTVRDLLYQVSGLSKATGNAHATTADTGDGALEERVRGLGSVELTQPIGEVWQYSNANYWTLGMIVQAVSGRPYETYVEDHILVPLGMESSFTSQSGARASGLVSGHRYWFGFPVEKDLPFDRGGLGAGGLFASAEDMARYVGVYLNGGRNQGRRIVSAAGVAELLRAGVPTGHEGVDYAMGWEVGESNGIATISHDGSTFNAHANVVMAPEGRWGVVLLENAENSPDEFFGGRRMSAIAFGVTSLLMGKQPLPDPSSNSLWAVYGAVLGILVLQCLGIARSVRKLRRWQAYPQSRPRGRARIILAVGPSLTLNLAWAFAVLVAVPQKVQAPLGALLTGLPDLGFLLVGSAVVSLCWGVGRTAWLVWIARFPGVLPHAGEPIAQRHLAEGRRS